MSERTIYKCDRCKHESETQTVAVKYKVFLKKYDDTPMSGIPSELCGDCFNDLIKFLDKKKP